VELEFAAMEELVSRGVLDGSSGEIDAKSDGLVDEEDVIGYVLEAGELEVPEAVLDSPVPKVDNPGAELESSMELLDGIAEGDLDGSTGENSVVPCSVDTVEL